MTPQSDHPRIRGEHTEYWCLGYAKYGSSPHTRGARASNAGELSLQRIIPAYAGSTRRRGCRRRRHADHPRIRGEHLRGFLEVPGYGGSSPHTRGAPHSASSSPLDDGIIPAYAGSTAEGRKYQQDKADHPRIRGEHRRYWHSAGRRQGSSPHTRGARADGSGDAVAPGIIPAYAGSTDDVRRRRLASGDHPRIRGEHRVEPYQPLPPAGSSPHTRGAPDDERRAVGGQRIIPAYAGSTAPAPPLWRPWPDHPRIRGEHVARSSSAAELMGSSPHTRGALPARSGDGPPSRIIPAYAGSTPDRGAESGSGRDHPRIRGEHTSPAASRASATGSSPHTRGAQDRGQVEVVGGGIIPAYAGSTMATMVDRMAASDHPRIRGEHSRRTDRCPYPTGSSPHTRGAPFADYPPTCTPADHPRIRGEHSSSPSSAVPPTGSSPHTRGARTPSHRKQGRRADHPRIRGEHRQEGRSSGLVWGSSPHTRGALASVHAEHSASRIIPAYAGSTRRAG